MQSKCTNLEGIIRADVHLINEHVERHAWYNHIADKETAKRDFVEKYMAIVKEMYCIYGCPKLYDCEIGLDYLRGFRGSEYNGKE